MRIISYTFEIEANQNSNKQIQNLEHAYIIADDIEIGFMNKIPMYLFAHFIRV
jgi:hypothetical protein